MKAARFLVALIFPWLLVSAMGCYTYVAVTPERLSPGQDVRARLQPDEGGELRSILGTEGSLVEGEVISQDDDALLLYVPTATRQVGFHSQTLKQRIRVPASSMLDLQRRELDRGRTALVATALGLGIGVLAWDALSGKAGANTSTGPGDDTSQSIRGLRIIIPLFVR